jgi:hypothetical protein
MGIKVMIQKTHRIKDDEMGEVCGTYGRKAHGVLMGKPEARQHLVNCNVARRIILKWVTKLGRRASTGLISNTTETNEGLS